MLLYLLSAILFVLLVLFIQQWRISFQIKRNEKSTELSISTLQQWIVSNDKFVMQNLGRMNELMGTLYLRIRMIDLTLRNKISGEPHIPGHELEELEAVLGKEPLPGAFINENTHKDAIEKIRSEDIHHYYSTLIEELRHLNRQISRGPARDETVIAAGNIPEKNEPAAPVNGWFNKVSKIR